MSKEKIIGKGTWIDKLASELIEREKILGRKLDLIRVESGLGASGIPHIGSLGDAVRAYGVKLALENQGYKSELIAYSDDLDGLRKVPEGLDVDVDNIGRRVSIIPDPFGSCHDSYGSHMSSLLLDGLDNLGIKYIHKTAYETYNEGLLNNQTLKILDERKKIGDKIEELTGQQKFQTSIPYFPECHNCKKLYTTKSYKYIKDEKKVLYRCKDSDIGYVPERDKDKDKNKKYFGCGHEGESIIGKDLGKLAWKVEFAARWKAFDIRFEAYGKDIMDSVKVNDWISDEILDFNHPHHVRYEMFLDKGGKKISKSLGNVITSQAWLKFGSPESILLLLYKRITGARELGFDDIPGLMNEYNELEDTYFGRIKVDNQAKLTKLKGLYEYVNLLNPPKQSSIHINYRLLIELTKIFKEDRNERVMKKLMDYGVIKNPEPEIEKLIEIAGNYSDEFDEQEKTEVNLNDISKKALGILVTALQEEEEPEDIQNTIYQIAKANGVQPKDFFKILYQIILGTSRGPKIGPFIIDIGRKQVAKTLSEYL
jgi:lysyl-tRNA synthetase class 1